jgi:HlyD family secretion protein
MKLQAASPWRLWAGILVVGIVAAGAIITDMFVGSSAPVAQAEDGARPLLSAGDEAAPSAVTVVNPRKGAMERLTTQPGSVQAFQSVQLFAKVSGFLKTQNVDIGDRVKKNQVLAIVDVPELEKQVQRDKAAVEQAKAKVRQMDAHVVVAYSDLDAANAGLIQAQAASRSAKAWVRYRAIRLQMMQNLVKSRSIEEKLQDEAKEHYEASVEADQAALAAISTTKAKIAACQARIKQAQADVAAAQAEVQVNQAELERNQVQVDFATIRAPFDGVVSYRSMDPGGFVRAANDAGTVPLLTVQRTDLMRVVVMVPDRDVAYADVGDPATLELDALPGIKLPAKISRKAESQDPQTRLMRIEIDLENPTGKFHNGMYCHATILLDKAVDRLSIPASCLASKAETESRGTVFVVRDGHAHRVSVRLGEDNGLRAEILGGLRTTDLVVVQPGGDLTDGAAVTANHVNDPARGIP